MVDSLFQININYFLEHLINGEILRIKEKGVPVSKSHRGDILIKVHIIIPKKLSKDTKKIVDQLRQEGI